MRDAVTPLTAGVRLRPRPPTPSTRLGAIACSAVTYASAHASSACVVTDRSRGLGRVWRNSGCAARPRWTPRCRVLGRPASNR